MLFIIKTSDGEYDDYTETIDAVLEGPDGLDLLKLKLEYNESRPLKRRLKDGQPYKNKKRDWSEPFDVWLVREKGFVKREFVEIIDGWVE